MTLSGNSDSRCPRCGQVVKIGSMYNQIKPHRDQVCKAACPTEGMTMGEARGWVDDARRKIKEMSQ